MVSIVIFDEDRDLADALARMLGTKGYSVRVASLSGDALASIAESPPDILLAEVRAGGGDVRTFLEPALRIAPEATPIVLHNGAPAAEIDQARALGAVAVLAKPFTPSEVEVAIVRAKEFGSGYRASLHGLNLADMLQMFHLSGRSVVLLLGGQPPGRIEFENGEIVHAERGRTTGVAALRELLATLSGSIRTAPYEGGERTIEESFAKLMLDVVHHADEAARRPIGASEPGELSLDRVDRALDSITEDEPEPEPPLPLEEGILEEAVLDVPELVQDAPSLMPTRRPTDRTSEVPARQDVGSRPESETEPPPAPLPTPIPIPSFGFRRRPYDAICRAVLAEVSGALACALVDLSNGAIVGAEGDPPLDLSLERTLAQHTVQVFRSPTVSLIERRLIGGDAEHAVEEAHLVSSRGHHLAKTIKGGRYAAVLVLPRGSDAGNAWGRLRALLPGLERNI